MINLASLTMTGGVRATIRNPAPQEGVALPTNYDFSFIESLSLIANGGIITQPFVNYKLLGNTLNDVYGNNDKNISRNALQGSLPGVLAPYSTDPLKQGYQPFSINNWISATQTMAPSYISTNLLGDLELRLTMADTSILASGHLVEGAAVVGLQERCSWDINHINFFVETASIESNMLDQAIAAKLAGGEPINVPFENVFSFTQTNGSSTYNQRFSVSSQSVNKILAVSQKKSDRERQSVRTATKGADVNIGTVTDATTDGTLVTITVLGTPNEWGPIGWLADDDGHGPDPLAGDTFYIKFATAPAVASGGRFITYTTTNSNAANTYQQNVLYNGIPNQFIRSSCNTKAAQFSINNQYSPNYQIDSQISTGLDLVTYTAKAYNAANVLVETRAAMDIPDYDYECADKLTSYTQMPFEYLGAGVTPVTKLQPSTTQLMRIITATGDTGVADNTFQRSSQAYWRPYVYKSGVQAFLDDKYLLATSFDLDVSDKDRLVSGINTLGSNAQMFLNVLGGAGDDVPNVSTIYVLCTSMVQIYQGATLQIIQ
tara:strand:+ start:2058 stop:3695 length:1638 start_codon:yes stop_codon:yes gene_type:complete